MIFSEIERDYLHGARLGRIATVNAQGQPRVVPVGFRLNEELGVIETGGRDAAGTRRWQDVRHNPNVAFVVDDVAGGERWYPRGIQIRGTAELVTVAGATGPYRAYIRIHPHTSTPGAWKATPTAARRASWTLRQHRPARQLNRSRRSSGQQVSNGVAMLAVWQLHGRVVEPGSSLLPPGVKD